MRFGGDNARKRDLPSAAYRALPSRSGRAPAPISSHAEGREGGDNSAESGRAGRLRHHVRADLALHIAAGRKKLRQKAETLRQDLAGSGKAVGAGDSAAGVRAYHPIAGGAEAQRVRQRGMVLRKGRRADGAAGAEKRQRDRSADRQRGRFFRRRSRANIGGGRAARGAGQAYTALRNCSAGGGGDNHEPDGQYVICRFVSM